MSVLTVALVAILMSAGLAGPGRALGAPAAESSTQAAARTWIIDAVDDGFGARWVSRDTGTSQISVQVGDTVEWHFDVDKVAQEHDLTSLNTRSAWDQPVAQARVPGDAPITRTFATAGTYDFQCSIHSETMSGTVVVGGDGSNPPPPDPDPVPSPPGGHDAHLPQISATATPASGAAPLTVALSAEVTTGGPVRAFSAGLTSNPDLAGAATMVRRRSQTYASLDASGLKPNAHHVVHVHEQACSSNNGGPHFRFDTAQPFSEANELWLPFTSDATGRSGLVEVTQPQRAGADAVSMVIHDPDNHALRIGCVDLAPGTAGLSYAWAFGDGTTGSGPDPDHLSSSAGTYTATLTVTSGHGTTATDSVVVTVVGAAPPPPLVPPPTPPVDDIAPLTDRTGPAIRRVRPSTATRDRTPTVRAQVTDQLSSVRHRSLVLRLDGDRVGRVRWNARRDRVTWTPRRALTPGRHTVRLVAVDTAGNRSARTWKFRVRR